jgi:uncharacterized membrane protein YhfC
MIGLPIALGVSLAKWARAPWSLFGIGAAAFIGSQIVHLPLNAGLTLLFKWLWPAATPQPWHLPFNALVLGLTAGVCEETARYLAFRWVAPHARSFRDALMLGAGHGGIEAIILGLLVAHTFIQMVSVRQTGLEGLGLTDHQLELGRQQLSTYWTSPGYMALMGAVERLFSLTVHVSLSLVVLQVFVRHQWVWLALAIGYHALSDAIVVFAFQLHWEVVLTEGLVGIFALGGGAMLWLLRPSQGLIPPEPEPVLIPGASMVSTPFASPRDSGQEQIDNSKYA